MRNLEVNSDANRLCDLLVEKLIDRMKMLLDTEYATPLDGGSRMENATPTEFMVAAYLNHPRFLWQCKDVSAAVSA